MPTTGIDVDDVVSSQQLGWIRTLLFERGIEHEPEELVTTGVEASAFIKSCLSGRVGTIQPITDEQEKQILALEAELGPRPDAAERTMPTDRAGANRFLRALRQVKYARSSERVHERLAALGIDVADVTPAAEDIPFSSRA